MNFCRSPKGPVYKSKKERWEHSTGIDCLVYNTHSAYARVPTSVCRYTVRMPECLQVCVGTQCVCQSAYSCVYSSPGMPVFLLI